jgi:hypothetical protein
MQDRKTSACDPGVRVLLHLAHRKQLECQSFPRDVFLSAKYTGFPHAGHEGILDTLMRLGDKNTECACV